MGAFEYVAIDIAGARKKGLIEADSEKAVRQRLRDTGLIPVDVNSATEKKKSAGSILQRQQISQRDLSLLTRQFAVLLKSGLPLAEVLGLLIEQANSSNTRKILLELRSNVLEGISLSDAINNSRQFPPLYSATVSAGESSGKLAEVFDSLADYYEDKANIHQKIKLSLIYPVLLTLVSIGVVISLLLFVIPEIVIVFENTGQSLPPLTQGLIDLNDYLQANVQLLLLLILSLVITFRLLLRLPRFLKGFHGLLLKIPLISSVSRISNTARFTRTLAILSRSEVEIMSSLNIASRVISNTVMRQSAEQALQMVREGSSLSNALQVSGHFPTLTTQLINSGETSGNLSEMLDSTASYHEREIQSLSATIVGLFEPVLILLMGGIVLTIVIAILLPIFEMNQLVG